MFSCIPRYRLYPESTSILLSIFFLKRNCFEIGIFPPIMKATTKQCMDLNDKLLLTIARAKYRKIEISKTISQNGD